MDRQALDICKLKRMVGTHFKSRYQRVMFDRLLGKLTPFQWWKMLRLCRKAGRCRSRSKPGGCSAKLNRFLLTAEGKLLYWFWRAVHAVRATLKLNSPEILNLLLLIAWAVALIFTQIIRLCAINLPQGFVPLPDAEIGGCARNDSLIAPLVN